MFASLQKLRVKKMVGMDRMRSDSLAYLSASGCDENQVIRFVGTAIRWAMS